MNVPWPVLVVFLAVGTALIVTGVVHGSKRIPKDEGHLDDRLGELAERNMTSVLLQAAGALFYADTVSPHMWYMRYFWIFLITLNISIALWRKRSWMRDAYFSMKLHDDWVAITNRIFVDVYGGMALVPREIIASRPY